MGKLIKIKESELSTFVNNLISEATPEGNTNSRPAALNMGFQEKIDGSLFKNGLDSIDTQNQQFLQVLNKLKTTPKTNKVTIIGGASAVGSSNGYDNNALAKRRAINFINALKSNGVDVSRYNISTKVGVSVNKNSPEANAEQFVKIISKVPDKIEGAIDNTAVEKPQDKINPIQRTVGNEFSYIKVPKKKLSEILDLLRKNGYKL
jgi:hypothetical protein